MRITIHKAEERGATELGWLHSKHSFSFGDYYNPKRIGFGLLKVLNDDIVEPGKGFGMHFHDNMEIVSIVHEGSLEHRDSMGNHDIIKAGEIQRMSAGTGVRHSEFNHSAKERVHFLQIWILTKERNINPSYEQKRLDLKKNELVEVVSGKKNNDMIYIHQDAYFLMGNFDKNKRVVYKIHNQKHGICVFVIDGEITIDKYQLQKGDSAEIIITNKINLKTLKDSKILLIEVPMS
ncbi:pirin family protein [Candidatus Woesearchaeota archaeon]|nr:pirin family protein [Candidatus Woesearchaeota archaeon]